jgi:taurine dioxygenase
MTGATATDVTVIPTGGALGAEIRGVSLSDPLSDAVLEAIRAACHARLVLLFRDQRLSDDQLIAFGGRFGELHRTTGFGYGTKPPGTPPEIEIISHLPEDAVPPEAQAHAETTWHTDMSMFDEPASFTLLYAVEVPSGVGQTRFANLYRAYEALPPDLRTAVEGRQSIHDISYTAMGVLRAGYSPVVDKTQAPGARHPIVRTHPATGRKALYLGRKGYGHIVGLSVAESDRILEALWVHMTKPEFVWEHEWRVGDVLMWDNRGTIHARSAYDPRLRRRLRRVTVKGERPV